MLNQYLDDNISSNTQMSLFCFPPDFSTMRNPLFGYHRSTMSNYDFNAYDDIPKQDHQLKVSDLGVNISQVPFQRSILSPNGPNFWACGYDLKSEGMSTNILKRSLVRDEDEKYQEHIGVSSSTMKNSKNKKLNIKAASGRRKMTAPRFSFKTMSDVDVLDDGYKWRKYGQKVVKDTHHPRSYYRCTQDNCRVKKRVERLAEDPRMVITTYEGRHMHPPNPIDDNNGDHILEF